MTDDNILLDIRGLHASIGDKEILKGIDMTIRKGEVHAVMGPNGAGKSTLSAVLVGRPDYTVTAGTVTFLGRDLLSLSPEERSWAGIFLSFQYPIEIPGVSITNFMKAAINARRKALGQDELSPAGFIKMMKEKMALVQMKGEFAKREVNVGFSGGEKKRNEIFQMAMLDPTLSILDETDSGLDVDALRIVAEGVNALRSPEKAAIVITHYQRLLEYIVPDVVHVLKDGRIVKTGGRDLVSCLRKGTPLASRVARGVSGPSSSCVWNPRVFADDARGWQCPFLLCLHPQGCLRRGVRASGPSQERTGESGAFGLWPHPRGSSRISS